MSSICVTFTGDGGRRVCYRYDMLLLQAVAVVVCVIDMCYFYKRWR